MSKVTLTNLVNLQNETTAVNAINANNDALEAAVENTLSRDGTSPNQMGAVLDMNSNRIINLLAADDPTQPVRKAEFDLISNGYTGNNLLAGTANEITITSGGGTSTFSLPSTLNLSSKTVNGDNFPDVYANLPTVLAWENGVSGNGSDQTAALQAIVDSLVDGGTIYLQGSVVITSLNLNNRANIHFKNRKGGSYAATDSYSDRARIAAGNGAGTVDDYIIDMTNAENIIFEDIWLYTTNSAYTGMLVRMGTPNVFSYATYNKFRNCILSNSNALSRSVGMYQCANTTFEDTNFTGPGIGVAFPDDVHTNATFATVNSLINCSFLPGGTEYPIVGSPGVCNLIGCLFEPGSDGKLRCFKSSSNRPFDGITIIGGTSIDASLGVSEPYVFPWGAGLTILGGAGGAPNGYMFTLGGGGITHGDPEERGLLGVSIHGYSCTGCVSMIRGLGTIANKTNVRGVVITGNRVKVGNIATTISEFQNAEIGPNNMYGSTSLTSYGVTKTLIGWPTYTNNADASGNGLLPGQEYIVTSTGARAVVI